MTIELIWVGPGWYVGLNFLTKRNWVQVTPNKAANPEHDWYWFETEEAGKEALGLVEKPVWNRARELY